MKPTTTEKNWKCALCSKIFVRKQYFERHVITHETNSQVKCEICRKKLKNRLVLYTHMKSFHSNKAKQRCQLCHQEFAMIRELRGHMERRHTPIEERPRLHCTFSGCPKTFLAKGYLTKHFNQQHSHNPVRYPCTLCKKEFTQKPSLDTHIATHTTEKRFKCATCGKSFTQKHSLQIHEVCTSLHSLPGPLYLPSDQNAIRLLTMWNCVLRVTRGRSHKASSKSDLKRTHLAKADRPVFPCRLCPLNFYSERGIWYHVKTYHDQNQYFCRICGKNLKNADRLKYHMRASHPTNEAPTYSCQYCEYQSRIKQNLTSHVARMHVGVKGRQCYFCGNKFYNFSHLASHCSRIHTLEK
ncbi:zinc finger protein 879-like isoform X1 [Folsomia candida]|uniref:zinc finger protein 879-like isoform X1 n=1 Tax=Folsomia candida TaxID=158441 RepID=UPI00160552E9|nr:zinc finger protein 879-like isoform X1 [Folsomia candida]